jgi:hypothetical protein
MDGASAFLSETSLLARARLLVGVRTAPTSALAAGLWLGGGYEGEFYDQFNALQQDGTTTFDDRFATSALAEARLRSQYVLFGPLVVRLRADALWHRISRAASSLVIGGGAAEFIDAPVEHADQLEVTSRVHLDLETSWLLGFVPSLAAGVDYFLIHVPDGTVARPIPVVAAGVRRIAF